MKALIAGLVLLGILVGRPASATEPIPVLDFFRPPQVTSPVVSPSGQYAAASMAGGAEQRQRLVILNLQDIAKSKVIAGFNDADIVSIRWVNDDRLVFSLTDRQSPASNQRGAGLFAVDREGRQGLRRLIKSQSAFVTAVAPIADHELSAYHRLSSVLRDGSDDVVVEQYVYDNVGEPERVSLWRLDTVTGRARLLTADAPDHVFDWAVDPRGVPRTAVSIHGGKTRIYWKAGADAAWTLVNESDTFTSEGLALWPLVVAGNDSLYAAASVGDDTQALVRVDMHKSVEERQALVSLKGYDFSGSLVFGAKGELLGVRYLTDARGVQWFDPALKKIQDRVDALLPGSINSIDCGQCRQPGMVLVTSWSDQQPEMFRVYDVKADTLDVLAASRPWIKPQAMATRDMTRFPARDGLSIPVHVTRPVGQKGTAPMVVLVHGGPWIRGGEWRWSADSQFLASRGYVVIEPEFRGSAGFGMKHFQAGWKQWGLAMQDDVADATDWAVKQGYADPQRVCIAGASYGGYAALMGLIRYPSLYRCGVEWVGVTDIDLLYSIHWSDESDMALRFGLPALVGDRKANGSQLDATSPLKLADRITQPLLMAYGGIDRRVPLDHGTRLRSAMRSHDLNPEWIVYPDEGHGWMLPATQVDFWTRVERFLDRNLRGSP